MSAASLTQAFPSYFMSDAFRQAEPADTTHGPTSLPAAEDASATLMLRVREGDVRAFEQLVGLHQGAIIGTAARMLGNTEDAHDVAQQVFLRVWKSAPRYEPSAKFTTWLFTITRNLIFNETRRRSRRKEIPLEVENDDEAPRQYADLSVAGPDEQRQQQELEDVLERAIQALPEKQRLAVVLRRHQELPYEELCEILDMSLSAVKSLLFRARAELRKSLQTYMED